MKFHQQLHLKSVNMVPDNLFKIHVYFFVTQKNYMYFPIQILTNY